MEPRTAPAPRGRPRTDPRSTSTGPDLEGVAVAALSRTDDAVALAGLDAALEHVATTALRAAPPGRVGLELEAHLVDLVDLPGRVSWDRVQAAVATLPTLTGGSALTLEPGGQVELSGPPLPDVAAAVAALRADRVVLAAALAADRPGLAPGGRAPPPVGADPLRPPQRVNPAARYAAMEQHFAAVGCAPAGMAMMTST